MRESPNTWYGAECEASRVSSLKASLLIGAVAAALFLVPRLRAAAERRAAGVIDRSESLRAFLLGAYLRSSTLAAWTEEHLRNVRWRLGPVRSMSLPSPVRRAYHTAATVLKDPPKWAASRNRDFVETEVKNLDAWFASRLGHPLTNSQSQAVVTDEDTTLVVAGAGAGKTSTLLAKVAYLIEHRGESPDSILILAFNASVADELRERVDRLDLPCPEIATFHGKGFDILGQAEGRKPAVSALARDDRALLSLVQDEFERTLADRKRRKKFERWWVSLRVSPKSLKECETPDERLRFEMALGLRTLTGVKVASIAEVKVADWLTLNDVDWEYERRYPHTPPSSKKREYTPDFFLPTKNAWLEVWSCDRSEERFPPQLDRDAYVEGMQWKRDLHRAHGTTLVELFQDEVWGPNPELHLSQVLELEDDTGATHPGLGEHLGAVRATTAPFVMLLATFLRLFRAGGWTRRNVEERAATKRDSAFLQIFWPFLERYEEELASESKIDFDTMLIEAAALTRDGA